MFRWGQAGDNAITSTKYSLKLQLRCVKATIKIFSEAVWNIFAGAGQLAAVSCDSQSLKHDFRERS